VVDIHSQHDTLLLASESYQLDLLDRYAGVGQEKAEYQAAYRSFSTAKSALEQLRRRAKDNHQEVALWGFQARELEAAGLKPGEQEEIEAQLGVLQNFQEIKERLSESLLLLKEQEGNITDSVGKVVTHLGKLSQLSHAFGEFHERLNSSFLELKDIGSDLETLFENQVYDREAQEKLEQRLSVLYALQKKYAKKSVEDLVALERELKENLEGIENLEANLAEAEAHAKEAEALLFKSAVSLRETRLRAISELERDIIPIMGDLSLESGVFKVSLRESVPTLSGMDTISFLFSANKGREPEELKRVASGGEFSRLMLSLKSLLATKVNMPTVIFDEIDSGLSGETGKKVGRIISTMAVGHQVLAITHLPQIAAMADRHFNISKTIMDGQTYSRVEVLTDDRRISTLARMMSGNAGESALQAAKDLLGEKAQTS
jgi:DNA repair protein RecN (Recombination protein N)